MLTVEEKKFLHKAAIYTMDYLVSRRARKNTSIVIKIQEIPKVKGRVVYRGFTNTTLVDDMKFFEVIVDKRNINKRGLKPSSKFKKLLYTMMHELVHVKQDIKNECFYYADGGVRFKGQKLNREQVESHDDDTYYNLPYEIEAYGREQHLVNRFLKMHKREENERKSGE